MILPILVLFSFGVCDLVRWSRDRVEWWHAALAVLCGAAATFAIAALAGLSLWTSAIAGAGALIVLSVWSGFGAGTGEGSEPKDADGPEVRATFAVILVIFVLVASTAATGATQGVEGPLAEWYEGLGFGFASQGKIPVDQFIMALGAALFLLATGNRIVGHALAATNASLLVRGESKFKGGRVLGPMERLLVAAGVVSGSLAGAGLVVAAKGLLRFRELRPGPGNGGKEDSDSGEQPGLDESTEYVLIGTFASVLIACAISLLVLASA